MTDRKSYKFTVKEFANGVPWIACEPMDGELVQLQNGLLGFDLNEGTSYEQAAEIASYMNDKINQINFTKL